MKNLIMLIMTVVSLPAAAFSFWPGGAAPCNTTLQACINGSPNGEYIEIRTNGPINENIVATGSKSLVAGNGYRPQFSAGNNVSVNSSGSSTVSVRGLTLLNGTLQIVGSGNGNNIYVTHNNVNKTNALVGAIRVYITSPNSVNIDVSYNQVSSTFHTSANDIGAIHIAKTLNIGDITGRVYGNTVLAVGNNSRGIMLEESMGGSIDLNVIGNEVRGGSQGGIYVTSLHNNSDIHAKVGSNALYRHDNDYMPSGIRLLAVNGAIDGEIVNNTMVATTYGIDVFPSAGASINAYVYNNLVAYAGVGMYFSSSATVNHDYNLVYEASSNVGYTPGPNALSVNPQIVGLQNPRLRPGSPAIDSAQSLALLALGSSPFIDADGGIRMKKKGSGAAQLDIGAYESGDVFFTHVNNNSSSSHTTALDHPDLNGDSGADEIHITSNYSFQGALGPYNNDNEGIYYTGGKWRIFNEGLVDIAENAAFNVFKFGATTNTFEHEVTTTGASTTDINQSGLDGEFQRILQVTQHYTGTYNDHPPGVWYGFGKWRISNFDLMDIPNGTNYNVYYQAPSKSAWEHVATAANIVGNWTILDNPIINGVPCAQVHVTQSASQGVFNGHPIGVWYDGYRWSIYNQNEVAMPEDAAFHVVVSPEQVAACSDIIFKDGFD